MAATLTADRPAVSALRSTGVEAWRWYLAAVCALAGAVVLWSAYAGQTLGDPILALEFVALAVIAQQAPVKFGPQRAFSFATGAAFALVLSAGPAAGTVLTAAAYLIGQCLRWRIGKIGPVSVLLNTAQGTLAAAIAGVILRTLHGPVYDVVLAALAFNATTFVVVALMVVLKDRRPLGVVLREGWRLRLEQAAGSLLIGWLTASALHHPSLIPVAMLVPAGALHLASRRLAHLQEREAALHHQTEQAEAYKAFLQIASHELRTPLTCLRGYAQSLARTLEQGRVVDESRLSRAVTIIDAQSDKLNRLIDQLLDVARIDRGKLVLEVESIEASRLVNSAVAAVSGTAPQALINIDIPVDFAIDADPLRLEQVLVNVLSNAVKFSPPEAPVEVAVRASQGGAEFVVRDHGPGIPEAQREAVFAPFVQAHGPEAVRGLGLGLYISREIVQRHGGTIWAEAPVSGGTCVVVRLPRARHLVPVPERARALAIA